MNAFITGSRAYGKPKLDSDIDLVVRVDETTALFLRENSECRILKNDMRIVRYGNLNLLLCTTDEEYAIWLVGTRKLERQSAITEQPINRDEAKCEFDKIRGDIGLSETLGSGEEEDDNSLEFGEA